jgi:hypothetical protein
VESIKQQLTNVQTCAFVSYQTKYCMQFYQKEVLSYIYNKLKAMLFQIIDNCFLNKNGTRKYKFLVIGKHDTYFVKHHSDSPHKYSEADIKDMLGFLVGNIYM